MKGGENMADKLTPEEQNLIDEIMAKRNETIQSFKVDFSVDDIPDVVVEHKEQPETIEQADAPTPSDVVAVDDTATQAIHYVKLPNEDAYETETVKKPKKKSFLSGCLIKLVSGLMILSISSVLSVGVLIFV